MAPLRKGVATPNWKLRNFNYLFVAQEFKFKVS